MTLNLVTPELLHERYLAAVRGHGFDSAEAEAAFTLYQEASSRPRCAVCGDAGCEHCPNVDPKGA